MFLNFVMSFLWWRGYKRKCFKCKMSNRSGWTLVNWWFLQKRSKSQRFYRWFVEWNFSWKWWIKECIQRFIWSQSCRWTGKFIWKTERCIMVANWWLLDFWLCFNWRSLGWLCGRRTGKRTCPWGICGIHAQTFKSTFASGRWKRIKEGERLSIIRRTNHIYIWFLNIFILTN